MNCAINSDTNNINKDTTQLLNSTQIIEFKELNKEDLKDAELTDLEKLTNELVLLNNIYKEFSLIIGEQSENILQIENNVIVTSEALDNTNIELLNGNQQQIEYTGTKLTISTIATSAITLAGLSLGGWKIALVAGMVSLVGGTSWAILSN